MGEGLQGVCVQIVIVPQGSVLDADVLDRYVFQVDSGNLYFYFCVCCTSDFENENGVKIENGIRPLGNRSRSGLGRIY